MEIVVEYFREGVAQDEYPKALEEQVDSFNDSANWRLDRMMLMEAYANERNIGRYTLAVSQIRDAIDEFTTKQMSKYFKVNESFCNRTIACIKEHPDWNDEQIVDAVEWDE